MNLLSLWCWLLSRNYQVWDTRHSHFDFVSNITKGNKVTVSLIIKKTTNSLRSVAELINWNHQKYDHWSTEVFTEHWVLPEEWSCPQSAEAGPPSDLTPPSFSKPRTQKGSPIKWGDDEMKPSSHLTLESIWYHKQMPNVMTWKGVLISNILIDIWYISQRNIYHMYEVSSYHPLLIYNADSTSFLTL